MSCSPPDEKDVSLGRIMTLYSRNVQIYYSLVADITRNQCPAFWLREKDGKLEEGLSVNWLEYFKKSKPQDAIGPLMDILTNKGFTVRASSKFALLNVGAALAAAARYT